MNEITRLLQELLIEQKRASRELTTIRQLCSSAVNYIVKAECEIPEFMRRFMNYMHDVHDVTYMYEERGQEVPAHHKHEMERCDDRFRQLLRELNQEGGEFSKIRRKMAEDPENRWDHTRQLTYEGKHRKTGDEH